MSVAFTGRFYWGTNSITMNNRNPYKTLRWTARITGVIIVAFTLFIFIGELLEGQKRNPGPAMDSFTPLILTIFVIWGIALAGLILALWKERPGGIISLSGFMLMYILNLFNRESPMRANAIVVFLLFSIPSVLYLICWKLKRDKERETDIIKSENSG